MPETLTSCAETEPRQLCRCHSCETEVSTDDYHQIDGESYCDECTGSCRDCGVTFVSDDLTETEIREGHRRSFSVSLCESCRDERHECDDCGCRVSGDEINHCWDCHDVCDRCRENYSSCEHCGDVYSCDNGPNCSCSDEGERIIRPYSEKVSTSPIGVGPIFFGVELEVTDTRGEAEEAAGTVQNIFGDFAIMKADGSIGDDGFEIVTRPASLREHKKRWNELFDNSVARRLRSWDGGKCGLHVHVSRRPLAALQLGKILWFVNEPAHTGFVERIAGRNSEQWAKRIKKKVSDGLCRKCESDRYQAINLCNRSTIEFRIFRGTLKRESFFRCVEFVAAIVRWCALPNGLNPSIESFKDWLETERKEYPNLFEFVFPGRKAVSEKSRDESGH